MGKKGAGNLALGHRFIASLAHQTYSTGVPFKALI